MSISEITKELERESVYYVIEELNFKGESLSFKLNLYQDDSSNEKSYNFDCSGVKSFNIDHFINEGDSLNVYDNNDNHPMLWEFLEDTVELMFEGKCKNPVELASLLCINHIEATIDTIPFTEFIEVETTISEIFEDDAGTLAVGPESLIDVYATVLNEYDYRTHTNVVNEAEFKKMTLIDFIQGHVICESFKVNKLS